MYIPTISFLLISLSWFSETLTHAATSQNVCPPSAVSVRVPPYLDPALDASNASNASNTSNTSKPPSQFHNSSYLAPPPSFFTGTWYLTNTSLAAYRNLSNLQWDLWPVRPTCVQNDTSCPPGTLGGTMADLTTWALNDNNANANVSGSHLNFGALGGGNRSVASIFGHDTPRRLSDPSLGPDWDGVFDINVSGGISGGFSESWSVLYWGLDAKGVPFMIVHESNPLCLDAFTRSSLGPDARSLSIVMDALVKLGNANLTTLVGEMGPVKWDRELLGGAAICPEAGCTENKAA